MEHILKEWRLKANALKKCDPRLAPIIESVGTPKLTFESDAFRALAQSILSQQLAVKAAQTIIGRFTELDPPFPSHKYLRRCRVTSLRKAGVSGQKSRYLKSLAEYWEDKKWRAGWSELSDEALTQRLTLVKGIGTWTAQMFLIFSLGRTNVLPILDFGIRRGVHLLFQLRKFPDPKEIPPLVQHWDGAYSVASWYLWQGQDRKVLK